MTVNILDDHPLVTKHEMTPPPTEPRLMRLADLLDEFHGEVEAAHRAYLAGIPRGPSTGFLSLDRELGGALQPGFHGVHGMPGVGKSALLLQVAGSCGCPAVYVSCEMRAVELLFRHISRVTSTELEMLRIGRLTPHEAIELARRAVAEAPLLAIADASRAVASAAWIQRAARAARGEFEHILVVIDSLNSWSTGIAPGILEYERLTQAVDTLASLGAALKCPVVAIVERNRQSMTSGGLNASAGSRRVEYAAETLWDLSLDDQRHLAGGEKPVTLTLAKNRGGAAGRRLDFRFSGQCQRFSEAR